MPFNPKYFSDGTMKQLRPAANAFSTYTTPDNIVIGIFQGNRGANPALDFKVRILFDGENKTPLLPPHTYWVVDLMLKSVEYQIEIKEIATYYLEFYQNCQPFANAAERVNYLLLTRDEIVERYTHINHGNTLSLDYVSIIIELFCLNEKQTPGAYMFRDLLQSIYNYADGAANYIELLEAAKPGNR
jgi:hypothetical protein